MLNMPEILKLTIRRGRRTFSNVFIFVSCDEKDYYRVVSVGQFGFDCIPLVLRAQPLYARLKGAEKLQLWNF